MYAGKQAGGDRVRVPGEAAPAARRKAAKPRDPDGAIVPRRRRSDASQPEDDRRLTCSRPGRDRMLSSPPQCVIDAASRCALRRGPSSAGAAR